MPRAVPDMTPDPPSGTSVAHGATQMPLGRKRARAAAGSALFLALVPGTMAVLIPYLLTGYEAHDAWLPTRIAGAALTLAGAAVLLEAFARFVRDGLGTPAPVAPTERLVVTGLYRHVRNPMYLAVIATILGQWLLLGRPVLLAYAIVFGAIVYAFVRGYEEPTLAARYGAEYERYRAEVPGWWPRLIEKT
jgi:protein-S-isoprenylcysteine O-methyltransferase Ste14